MRFIGQRVRRVEDPGLLTGVSEFTGDIGVDAFEISFVRSVHAHARITRVDLDDACLAPGVVGVFAAGDFDSLVGHSAVPVPPEILRPHLATDVVRFVGEIVAVVVARSLAEAQDAAELVVVEYEPLPHAVGVASAMAHDAPLVFDALGTNRVMHVEGEPGPDFADGADLILEIEMYNQRVGAVPLETNAVVAIPEGDGLRVYASTQAPHNLRDAIAEFCGLEPAQVRVIAPSVGGAFGAKSTADPEHALTCLVSQRLAAPVRWRQTRTENLTTMHGRAQHQRVRVAARADGTLLRLHADLVSDGAVTPASTTS
jgi:carbon-monoxide dehydrogenase large subunit